MARPPTRPEPNRLDPLSEPTIGRRQWAAYLARGWTRADFARRMKVAYQTVDRWDTGQQIPGLDLLERSADLLGLEVKDLVHGHRPGDKPATTASSSPVLDGMTAEDRDAVARLVEAYLGEVVHTFFAVYHAEREAGLDPTRAFKRARDIAHDARARATKEHALATAVALGAKAATGFAVTTPRTKRR